MSYKATLRGAFESKPIENLIMRRKWMGFSAVFLVIVLVALLAARLVSGFDAGLVSYLFCAGMAGVGFINYNIVGEIIEERKNAPVKGEG